MSTPTDQLIKVQDQILETLASIQKPVVEAVRKLAERAESVVPEIPKVPGRDRLRTDQLPPVDELIVSQFAFAEKLLTQQKDFTSALILAVKPVSGKVATPPRTRKAAA
jgi:hypothetical protein